VATFDELTVRTPADVMETLDSAFAKAYVGEFRALNATRHVVPLMHFLLVLVVKIGLTP
jgi:hypothetical protein